MGRTVTCSHCWSRGHNKRGCPQLKEYAAANPDSYQARRLAQDAEKSKNRRCSYCGKKRHNRRGCAEFKVIISGAADESRTYRRNFVKYVKDLGLSPGALLVRRDVKEYDHSAGQYVTHAARAYQLVGIEWDAVDYRVKDNAYRDSDIFVVAPVWKLLEGSRQHFSYSAHASAKLPNEIKGEEARADHRMAQWELASPGSGSAIDVPSGFVNDISEVKRSFKSITSDDFHDNRWKD